MILAVTGHRPQKLGGYGRPALERLYKVALQELSVPGPTKVLTGMALGWDTAVALACFKLDLPYVACVPCEGQEKLWPAESQERYKKLLAGAEEAIMVSEGPYHPNCMMDRNIYMVDHCEKLVAMWDGKESGGTWNCIEYARTKVPIVNLYKEWKEMK